VKRDSGWARLNSTEAPGLRIGETSAERPQFRNRTRAESRKVGWTDFAARHSGNQTLIENPDFGWRRLPGRRGALCEVAPRHEPQRAAGILPAEQSDESIAGKMPAAPWRCRLTAFRFMVPMHARKAERALHEPTHPRPLPRGEQASVAISVPLLGGGRGGFMVPCTAKMTTSLSLNRSSQL